MEGTNSRDMSESPYIDMVNDDLTHIPSYTVCPPYSLEFYREGFEEHWVGIHRLADTLNEVDLNVFNGQFSDRRNELRERQIYLRADDRYIGTATAWDDLDGPYKGYGRIHWLAVVPAYQNRGFGRSLICETMKILKHLGFRKACLGTDRRRPNAVHLYEEFGFSLVGPEGVR
jgi:ribosomal protein S18 acetylase RimI-like enzyme